MIGRVPAAVAAIGFAALATAVPHPASALADAVKPASEPTAPASARPAEPAPVRQGSAPAGPDTPTTQSAAPAKPQRATDTVPEPVKLSDDPRPSLSPETVAATRQAAERYSAILAVGGWPSVPNEATRLKAGESGPTAIALRRRLAVTGDMPAGEPAGLGFDDALAAGLRRFQARHGLEETGIVGPRTLAALNVPAAQRLRQLQGSALRLTGWKFPFGERYIVVNIPSAVVEAVERGQVAHRYVAIVGKPDRPSPQLETRATSVRFNPTWTVPTSLIRKDIIPHVRKDPNYLARLKIRLFDSTGAEVDPGTVDWSTERAASYTIRQDSGLDNSLGEVRIDMPNRYAVYMHDTPSKRLFARQSRAQSSGCVRVAGVKGLAAWLLEGTVGPNGAGSGWGQIEIETAVAAGQRVDVRVARPVPIAWVYLTGFAAPDGTVQFRDDIYGIDEPPPPPSPPAASAPLPTPGPQPGRQAGSAPAVITSLAGTPVR